MAVASGLFVRGSTVREWISCTGKTEATDSFAGCSLTKVGKNNMNSFVQDRKWELSGPLEGYQT
jgi:hypothetical protein